MSQRIVHYETMDLDGFEELLADQPSNERWELIGGRVIRMMVGARWQHNVIIQNIGGALRQRFRESKSDCRTYTETFFLKSQALKTAALPDVIVRCGPLADDATSLDDPRVLVEVVSPGSEARDHVDKGKLYRQFPSLQHYVLIDRMSPSIEVYDRAGDAWAIRRAVEGLEAILDLPAVNARVPLRTIYEDVFFD